MFLNRTSHTALHLGLVKAVKTKYPEKEYSVTANHYDQNAAPDSFVKKKSQSLSQSQSQEHQRPKSAPALRKKLDNMIKQPSDLFTLKEVVKEMTYRGSWDPSQNDNLFNSNYNSTIPDIDKNNSIYVGKRSIVPDKLNYLNDQPNILLMKEKHVQTSASSQQLRGSTNNWPAPDVSNEGNSRPKSAGAILNNQNKVNVTDGAGEFSSPPRNRRRPSSSSAASSVTPTSPTSPDGNKDTPITSSLRGMKKLSNMRKNVSFQDDVNIIEFIESQQQLEREEAERNAKASRNSPLRMSFQSDSGGEDGTSNGRHPERRMSTMSDISFEYNFDGEYYEFDEEFRHSAQPFADNPLAFPPLTDITPERLMEQIGINLQSKFEIPIKCIAIEENNEVEKEVQVVPQDSSQPLVTEKRKLGFMIYDVGYYLPGNEEMASYQPIYEQKSNNGTTTGTTTNDFNASMVMPSASVVIASTPNNTNHSAPQPAVSHPELFQHGISLPTTTGLLVVIYYHTSNNKTESSSSTMRAQGVYMSINQLINLAQKHVDYNTLVVLSEMNTFAYQYNPVPKPLNKNNTASAMSNMIGTLKGNGSNNGFNPNVKAPPSPAPGKSPPAPSPAGRLNRSQSITEAAGIATIPRNESSGNFFASPSKFAAGAKKVAESAKAEAKAKKLAEEIAAAKEAESKNVRDNGSNKQVVIDKELQKAIIYPCLLDVADSEGMVSLMHLIIKHAEVTIDENPSEGQSAVKIAYKL